LERLFGSTLHTVTYVATPSVEPVRTAAMSSLLGQVRKSVQEQRRAMDDALNAYAAAAGPDCVLALDASELDKPGARVGARKAIYNQGWRLAYMTAFTLGDHLAAIGDVAQTEAAPSFAHMTLARATLEAAARVAYLLDHAITVEGRVLRAGALLLASTEEELLAVADLERGNSPIHPTARAQALGRQRDLMRMLNKAKIRVHRDSRDRLVGVYMTTPDQIVKSSPVITTLLRDLMPDRPGAYRFGSGAAHGQPWVLDDDAAFDLASRRLDWRLDPAGLAGSVDLAISASTTVIRLFAAMLGQDASAEVDSGRRREQAVAALVWPLLR
jgi:hypothetical protein